MMKGIKVLRKISELWCKRSSDTHIKYLVSNGARVGTGTVFINSKQSSIDSGRIKYLTIGSNCVICSGVSVIMHDYSWYVLGNKYGNLYPSGGQPVVIGDNVFVGAHSLVLGNTTIGNNVIIAAGSVVKGTLASDMVYGGNPAKPIMSIEEYNQKRATRYLLDAKREVAYYQETFGRLPHETEMKNYEVLFAERDSDRDFTAKGFSDGKYKEIIMNTQPTFHTFKELVTEYSIKSNDQ